jgi:hypothetical protein
MAVFKKFMFVLAMAAMSPAALAATPSPAAQAEIEQLLSRLASSGCEFQRNGSWHDGAEARAHIERKYRYLLNRQLVGTTEEFISRAASESSMSGKPYQVKCGDVQETSSQWMSEQLKQMRVRVQP